MFSMKTGDIKNPMVRTSMNGGLSVEDYAEIERCYTKSHGTSRSRRT